MNTVGTVRFWHDDEGWGVVDSPQTPGGCWAHFSNVAVAGYRKLTPGETVHLGWEVADQDGYAFRATRVWPSDRRPVDDAPDQNPDGIYSSSLTITYDAGSHTPRTAE
ncbi:cold-shock protein [Arthrobacter sp. ERGS1:01]|uniref:cold shock domain-containing protein n=1 Tax=Arthrobacter sp. ERGS1:01 TaxID=1704044 RepID=UPI0006B41F9E|nr:cold shock domain-containing protein [Arthrobacter sp. ERGS1:01]ALE07295.1 cold-shock protein [Arthrobacter sp. ERGS1:01]